MMPTPGQPSTRDGLGAVTDHRGETVGLCRRRQRRQAVADRLQTLVDRHPTGTIYVAWDHADTHADQEVEAVVRAAAGRLVWLYLPTYSPWLNSLEMRWRPFRRDVTHGALLTSLDALAQGSARVLCPRQPGHSACLIDQWGPCRIIFVVVLR